jgi:hypothetical protein
MASGTPSSRRQMVATVAQFEACTEKPGTAADAL